MTAASTDGGSSRDQRPPGPLALAGTPADQIIEELDLVVWRSHRRSAVRRMLRRVGSEDIASSGAAPRWVPISPTLLQRGRPYLDARRICSAMTARVAEPCNDVRDRRSTRASLDIGGAGIGQRDAAARSMEKPRVQVILKLREAPADRRQRRAKPARRRRKTPGLHHRQQRRHRFEPVHRHVPFSGNTVSNFSRSSPRRNAQSIGSAEQCAR